LKNLLLIALHVSLVVGGWVAALAHAIPVPKVRTSQKNIQVFLNMKIMSRTYQIKGCIDLENRHHIILGNIILDNILKIALKASDN